METSSTSGSSRSRKSTTSTVLPTKPEKRSSDRSFEEGAPSSARSHDDDERFLNPFLGCVFPRFLGLGQSPLNLPAASQARCRPIHPANPLLPRAQTRPQPQAPENVATSPGGFQFVRVTRVPAATPESESRDRTEPSSVQD